MEDFNKKEDLEFQSNKFIKQIRFTCDKNIGNPIKAPENDEIFSYP